MDDKTASDCENELLNTPEEVSKEATPSQSHGKVTVDDLASAILSIKQELRDMRNPAPRERSLKRKREHSPAVSDPDELSLMDYQSSEDDDLLAELYSKKPPAATVTAAESEQSKTVLDQDLYDNLASSFDDDAEVKGPSVSPTLAKLLNDRYGTKLPYEKLKEKMAKHLVPKNCTKLAIPKTNEHVYRALKPQVRHADTRLRNTQQTILKAAVAVTKAADTVITVNDKLMCETRNEDLGQKLNGAMKNMADAIALMGHANIDLSQKRRDMHRSMLPKQLKGITAPHVAMSTEYLYPAGGDFQKTLQEAREAYRMNDDMRSPHPRFSHAHGGSSAGKSGTGQGRYRQQGHGERDQEHFLGRAKGGFRGKGKYFPRKSGRE